MAAKGRPPIYLDYNATAPVLPVVAERMQAALTGLPGNPSSPHRYGQSAKDVLEGARESLAALLGFNRREITFTSGGSEGNTMLLRWPGLAEEAAHIITSPIEHPSVLRTCEWLSGRGVEVSYLPVNGRGVVEVDAVTGLLRPETRIVSLMTANNETGVIQPVAEMARLVRAHESGRRVLVHTDAVQAFGRIPLPLRDWDVDAVTLAAHKLGGPKGIGVVALRGNWPLPGLVLGGEQERGLRAGTESVFLVEGMLAAAEWAWPRLEEERRRLEGLRDRLAGQLEACGGFFLNGGEVRRLPNTANLGFAGVPAQSLLVAMDLAGVAVSTGSACQSGAVEPSHVLTAMGLPEERVGASLRISLGHGSSEADVDRCAAVMLAEVARLRRSASRYAS
ncbi:MAG: cysteine desulfurase family protein [SAR324 cluster bacterium]|nr:cysteine desulfurase family protein [SAR324 cluster bacterium]